MISLFGLRTPGMYASDFFCDASEGAKHAQPTPRRFGSGTYPESIRAVSAATWKRQQPTGNSQQAVEVDLCDTQSRMSRFHRRTACASIVLRVTVGFHPFSQILFLAEGRLHVKRKESGGVSLPIRQQDATLAISTQCHYPTQSLLALAEISASPACPCLRGSHPVMSPPGAIESFVAMVCTTRTSQIDSQSLADYQGRFSDHRTGIVRWRKIGVRIDEVRGFCSYASGFRP